MTSPHTPSAGLEGEAHAAGSDKHQTDHTQPAADAYHRHGLDRADGLKNTVGVARAFAFCWHYWRQHPRSLAVLSVAGTLGPLILDVGGPVATGYLIDALEQGVVQGDRNAADPLFWLALYIAATATYVVMRHIGEYVWIRLAARVMHELTQDAFRRVQVYSTDWHANHFAGSTVRSITRGMWAFDTFGDTLYINLLPTAVVLCGVTLALFATFPLVGGLAIGFTILFTAVSIGLVEGWAAPALARSNEADTEIGGALADAIGGNAAVKSFAAELREEERFAGVMEAWRAVTLVAWGRMVSTSFIQGALWVGFKGAVLASAVWLWSTGAASVGDVVFILICHYVIGGYLRDIGHHIRNLQKAVSELEDVVLYAARPIDIVDAPDAKPLTVERGEITFDQVTFAYAGQSRGTYRDFSITLKAGEKVALVGVSGSGKSTFTKLIQRLYELEGGRILIDGQDIARVTQASLRQAIAVVPQDPALFHRSLAQNIAYGRPDAGRGEVLAAAGQAHADRFIDQLPLGYETLVGERGIKLSGGERQRIAVARAILAATPVLILDEATSALDSESEAMIQDALETLMEGRTTIIIAHRLSTIRHVDRILVFEDGHVVEDGSHDALLANPSGLYRRLYEIQAGGFLVDRPVQQPLAEPIEEQRGVA